MTFDYDRDYLEPPEPKETREVIGVDAYFNSPIYEGDKYITTKSGDTVLLENLEYYIDNNTAFADETIIRKFLKEAWMEHPELIE